MSVINAINIYRQETSLYVINSNMSGRPMTVSSPKWDSAASFHGSVHTATLAVCTVLVIFIVVLGTFGNGLVLLSALHNRKIRSNFDVLVLNLAVSDLIICSCLSPTFLYLLFSSPPSTPEFCSSFLFTSITCGLVSLLSLVAIAAHRQLQLRGSAKGSLTTSKTVLMLVAIYVISLATATGGSLHVYLSFDPQAESCQAVLNSQNITSNNVVVFFISPVVIISFIIIVLSYSIIARAVRTQTYLRVKSLQPILRQYAYRLPQSTLPTVGGEKANPMSPDMQKILDSSVETGGEETVVGCRGITLLAKKSETLHHCHCCSCVSALDKENKAVTMCLVVILIISLCWAPLILSHLIELVTGESIILYQVKLCGIALVFLNSALDPYLYSQNDSRAGQRYGRVCWNVLRCECRAPSRHKFQTLANPKQKRSVNKRLRTGPVIAKDVANLQFLQPKLKRDFMTEKTSRTKVDVIKESRKSRAHRHHKRDVIYGSRHLGSPVGILTKPEVRHKVNKRAGQSGVKSLVEKTFCQTHCPSDQSLVES